MSSPRTSVRKPPHHSGSKRYAYEPARERWRRKKERGEG
jgi:hypothetical protein